MTATQKKAYERLSKIASCLNSWVDSEEREDYVSKQKYLYMETLGNCPHCNSKTLTATPTNFRCSNCFYQGKIDDLEEFIGINNDPHVIEYVYYNTLKQPILKIHFDTKKKKNPYRYYEIFDNHWREEKILRVAAVYNAPELAQTRTVLFVDCEADADAINQKIKEENINYCTATTNAGGIYLRQKGEFDKILRHKTIYIALKKTVDEALTAQNHALWLFNTIDAKTRGNTKIIDPGFDQNETLLQYLTRKNLTLRKFLEDCKHQKDKIPTNRLWQELINPSYKPVRERTESQVILDRLKEKYDLRFNLAKLKPEYKTKYEDEYKTMDEREINTMILDYENQYAVPRLTDKVFQRITNSYYVPTVNPFQEYYESLNSWDGITDPIADLSRTITFADESEAVRFFIALKKFLVGVVATTMGSRPTDLGLFFASLDGGQGKGKTTWLHHLSPQKMRERYHSIGRINFIDKDSYVALSEHMFIQLDEFDQYTKHEVSIIKNFMTQRYVNIRRHFGKGFAFYPRMASFLGSLNKSRFLTDDTGNRRYLIFVPLSFRNKGSHNIDMDKVYAQAFGLWQGGFSYWLNQKEIDELNETNKQFIIGSMEEEMIENYYRPATDDDAESKIKKLQTFELVETLMNKSKQEIDAQKVTKALYRLGYEKKSSRVDSDPRKVWLLVEK